MTRPRRQLIGPSQPAEQVKALAPAKAKAEALVSEQQERMAALEKELFEQAEWHRNHAEDARNLQALVDKSTAGENSRTFRFVVEMMAPL